MSSNYWLFEEIHMTKRWNFTQFIEANENFNQQTQVKAALQFLLSYDILVD